MLLLILISYFLVTSAEQPCEDVLSVDISDGKASSNGTIEKHGVSYPAGYTYAKKVDGEVRAFGCLCDLKSCFSKCCDSGSVFSLDSVECEEDSSNDLLLNNGLNLSVQVRYRRTVGLGSQLAVIYRKPCELMHFPDSKWYVQEDGKLYLVLDSDILLLGPDKYCVDTFISTNNDTGVINAHVDALICFEEEDPEDHFFSSICMLISCAFLLVTVGVYAFLPELRNLHGKVLMSYLTCLFVAFAFLATMQLMLVYADDVPPSTCRALAFIIYFFLETAFFWLNVMCFDIWWTFRIRKRIINHHSSRIESDRYPENSKENPHGKRGHSSKMSSQARFRAYCAYAFGIPALMTIVIGSMEAGGLVGKYYPNLREGGCFFYGVSKQIYLYGPMVILCIANSVFFILTAWKIAVIKKQTSVLKSKESSTHDVHRNDKQRFVLYVKLFAIMGINWILEVVSASEESARFKWLWKITDAYNVLIGVIVFIIFVCKRKTLRLIKKRYRQLRGENMSRSGTTSTRTFTSNEMQMGSVKNKP